MADGPSFLRSLAWRSGRKAYLWARGEDGNDPARNGEYDLLKAVARSCGSDPAVLLDVGCNRGDWTARALDAFGRSGRSVRVDCFEPDETAFAGLRRRFAETPKVNLHRLAVADSPGRATFHVVEGGAGTNSLSPSAPGRRVEVQVTTVGAHCAESRIPYVDMIKSDVEGYDAAAIDGGVQMLERGQIGLWQFEYNHRWVESRRFLKDVFDRAALLPYHVGRVVPGGVLLYPEWHFELERFFESNFVLVHDSWASRIGRPARLSPSNVYL